MAGIIKLFSIILLGLNLIQASQPEALEGNIDNRKSVRLISGEILKSAVNPDSIFKNLYFTPRTVFKSFRVAADEIIVDKDMTQSLNNQLIRGDIRNFDFSNYALTHVYLQGPLSLDESYNTTEVKPKSDILNNASNNIGKMITNIYAHMIKNSKIEIEWLPCIGLDTDQVTVDQALLINPFTCYQNMNIAFLSVEYALGLKGDWEKLKTTASAEINKAFREQAIKIQKLIRFYKAENLGSIKQIIQRLRQDIEIVRALMCTGGYLMMSCLPDASFDVFAATPKSIVQYETQLPGTISSKAYVVYSLFGQVLRDLTIENNWPLVKKYLEDNGFTDVKCERKETAHTHLRNIPTITATKI